MENLTRWVPVLHYKWRQDLQPGQALETVIHGTVCPSKDIYLDSAIKTGSERVLLYLGLCPWEAGLLTGCLP